MTSPWRKLALHAADLSDAGHDSASRGLARRISAIAIANTETVVLNYSNPGQTVIAGTTFRIRAYGRLTSGVTPGSSIFRCRLGTTTLTGVIPVSLTLVNGTSVTAAPFSIEMIITYRTNGISGTASGNMHVIGGAPAAFTVGAAVSAISATVTISTVSAKFIELTYISGNAGTTATFEHVVIEKVHA